MSLQICAPASVIRNEKHEKPNNSNNTCPYKTAKVRHLPQQIQSLSAQPPLPNVKHALVDADLNSVDLRGVILDGANLKGAKLYYADLSGAQLNGANLKGANLTGTNLTGADGLILAKELDEACCNENTKLPEGFMVKPCPVER